MLLEPLYRKDYTGELITDGRKSPPQKILVKPKKLFYRENSVGRAIVIGNGISRRNTNFNILMTANSKRPMPGYKITYACNGAAWDVSADYYIVNNRILMGHLDKKLWPQFFVPYDMFIDYKKCHMLPHVNGLSAGAAAIFLACFDGHDEVYMFGFDGQQDSGKNNNIYADCPCYDSATSDVSDMGWYSDLYQIMRAYSHVMFYRVGGGRAYPKITGLKNFKDVNYNSVVVLGDF